MPNKEKVGKTLSAVLLQRLGELKREKSFTMILVPGNHDRVHPMCGMDSVVEWTCEV